MEQTIPKAHSSVNRVDRQQAILALALTLAGLLVVQAPILRGMIGAWLGYDDHAHGLIVAPLAIAFAFQHRKALSRTPLSGSWLGLIPLSVGLLAVMIGSLGGEFMILRMSFPFTLAGLVLLLAGRAVFRILLFPLCFAFLMIPLPQSLLNVVAFPLQLVAAQWAVASLQALGIPALVEGNIIHLARAELFVAEACSGLRSLTALITLGVVFAHVVRRGRLAVQIALVASTIPIAIVVNSFRVALTGFLAHHFGVGVTHGAIHDFQGFITFGIALALLFSEATLIDWVGKLRRSEGFK